VVAADFLDAARMDVLETMFMNKRRRVLAPRIVVSQMPVL
jgi:hypothetical protein